MASKNKARNVESAVEEVENHTGIEIAFGKRSGKRGGGRADKYPWDALREAFKAWTNDGKEEEAEPYFTAPADVKPKAMAGSIQARRQKMRKLNRNERYHYELAALYDEEGVEVGQEVRVYVDM